MPKQAFGGALEVRHLQGKADWPTNAFTGFDLINDLGLGLVKNLQGGHAHIENHRLPLPIIPELRGLNAKRFEIEFCHAFKVAGRQRNT